MYTPDEMIKIAVEQKSLPKYLYKFRAINESTEKIFTDSTMWFSEPDSFNDPFDCRFVLNYENTETEIRDYLKRNGITKESTIESIIADLSHNKNKLGSIIEKNIQNHISQTGVNCFSERNDSILMWSHYTDSHKGICLKFDIEEDAEFFTYPIQVEYQDSYTDFNYIREERNFIKKIISPKSKDWHYEKEYRIVKPQKKGAIQFKKESLKEIIFGVKADKRDIKRIKMLVKQNGFKNIKYKRVVLSNESYELKVTPL